jgi:integrase
MSVLERLKDRMYRLEPTTQTVYLNAMKQLVEFAGEKEVYDGDDMTGLLAQKGREGRKKTTLNNYFHFKVIWEIMGWEWTLTPKARPSRNKPYQPFYNLREMQALMKAADEAVKTKGRYGEFLKLRNKLLVRLDAGTVLRVGEIARLDVENCRRPYLYIMNPEKDSEYTQRLLDAETCDLMDQYLKARRRYKSPALFITKTGKKPEGSAHEH